MKITPEQVTKLAHSHMQRLGLDPSWWRCKVKINRAVEDVSEEEHRDSEAYVRVRAAYFSFTLTVNAYNIGSEDYLSYVVAHEVAHVVVDEAAMIVRRAMKDEEHADRIVENLVERISRAIVSASGQTWAVPNEDVPTSAGKALAAEKKPPKRSRTKPPTA